MSNPSVVVGDTGTRIIYTVKDHDGAVIDLSGATTMELIITIGSTSSVTLSGTLVTDGTDGQVYFTSLVDTWPESGKASEQLSIATPDGSWRSSILNRHVLRAI